MSPKELELQKGILFQILLRGSVEGPLLVKAGSRDWVERDLAQKSESSRIQFLLTVLATFSQGVR